MSDNNTQTFLTRMKSLLIFIVKQINDLRVRDKPTPKFNIIAIDNIPVKDLATFMSDVGKIISAESISNQNLLNSWKNAEGKVSDAPLEVVDLQDALFTWQHVLTTVNNEKNEQREDMINRCINNSGETINFKTLQDLLVACCDKKGGKRPTTRPYTKRTLSELRALAKQRKLKGYSSLNKTDLVALLRNKKHRSQK